MGENVKNTEKTNDDYVVFQDQEEQLLPMSASTVPFYKRARGCRFAEEKANERASALEELAEDSKPTR